MTKFKRGDIVRLKTLPLSLGVRTVVATTPTTSGDTAFYTLTDSDGTIGTATAKSDNLELVPTGSPILDQFYADLIHEYRQPCGICSPSLRDNCRAIFAVALLESVLYDLKTEG